MFPHGIWRLAVQILLAQSLVTLTLALAAYGVVGLPAARSVFWGGAIGVLGNLYMSFSALRPAAGPGKAFARLLLGQAVKLVITITGFFMLAQTPDTRWGAVVLGFVATLIVFWAVPMFGATGKATKG
jgi:F0F1-type ATP synthase assembly protein I